MNFFNQTLSEENILKMWPELTSLMVLIVIIIIAIIMFAKKQEATRKTMTLLIIGCCFLTAHFIISALTGKVSFLIAYYGGIALCAWGMQSYLTDRRNFITTLKKEKNIQP